MLIFMRMNAANTIEIPGLITQKITQKLVFNTDGITIQKASPLASSAFLPAANIAAFRYGVSWIRGYRFVFGRQYFVEVQADDRKISRIKLGSYYGIRKEVYGTLWNDIIQQLWQNYFVNLFNYYHDLYKIHQTFELCGISFHFAGICWDQQDILPWHTIAISSYSTYFMIYNCQNKKQCKSKNFANDWNAVILQVLLKEIVKERNVMLS
ncbi:hypothetical protein ACFGVS_27970 [Mucilaginibacter sp. AW1-7]|uniref:hypothetical protein n=1 Tax=Mucilaginibacter sp. AW1-7 TaxID=3349874 RepID=UPI003F73367B